MDNIQSRIALAVVATRETIPGYFEKALAQRAELSGKAAGSVYEGVSETQLENKILNAVWEEYSHPDVQSGCTAYKAAIPGRLGIVTLAQLSADKVVRLDDRKNTGKVSCVMSGVRGEVVPFTVLILGLEQGKEVVFTFHPGDPIRASQVQAELGMHGQEITVKEAIAIGLETAKIE